MINFACLALCVADQHWSTAAVLIQALLVE